MLPPIKFYRCLDVEDGAHVQIGSLPDGEESVFRFAYHCGDATLHASVVSEHNCNTSVSCLNTEGGVLPCPEGIIEVHVQPSGQTGDQLSVGIAIESPQGVIAGWSLEGEIS